MAIQKRSRIRRGDWIVQDPGTLSGEPVARGGRIAVRSIVRAFASYGDRERVLQAFPSLRPDQIDAAMRLYEANRDLVRRYIEENEAAAFKRSRPARARPA
jgi:uncharacterized protein (DUF433 family)